MPPATSALTKTDKPLTLKQEISGDYFKSQLALALPKHMTPDRFVRVALTAILKTPKLLDCTKESVVQCMLNCSALGLEPDGRRAHLIPYGNSCTLIIDYKGLVELARRSGDVSNILAQIVCANDTFTWENGEVKHQINFKMDRGEMYAAYAVITFKDGTKQSDVMTKAEIDAIRKRSRASNSGPWVTDYNEMAKKTVFRRATKWITLSPEVADALEKDEAEVVPSKPKHTLEIGDSAAPSEAPESPEPERMKNVTGNSEEREPEQQQREPEPAQEAQRELAPEPVKPAEQKPLVTEDPDAVEKKLIEQIFALATSAGVTEGQVVNYAKKQKLCSKNAQSLNDFVAQKLELIITNFQHVLPQIKEMPVSV
jgi:recombination protein RecT